MQTIGWRMLVVNIGSILLAALVLWAVPHTASHYWALIGFGTVLILISLGFTVFGSDAEDAARTEIQRREARNFTS